MHQGERAPQEAIEWVRENHWRKRAGIYIELWKHFLERNKDMRTYSDLKWFEICQDIEMMEMQFPVYKRSITIEIDVRRSTLEDIDRNIDAIIKPIREEAHIRHHSRSS